MATKFRESEQDLPVFTTWMEFLAWLLPATAKFPRQARFSFAQRIDNLALEIVEDLVEARYAKNKQAILQRASLRLEKLRVLVRLSHMLRYLPHAGYEHITRNLNETGRMLGGWLKSREAE